MSADAKIPGDLQGVVETSFGERLPLAQAYADLLVNAGIEWGLIGPREAERIWERHLVNSLAIAPLLAAGTRLADLGSGAGLPGIPLAIARPDCQVTLVEPMARRVEFLQLAVERLGLTDQVQVVRARSEDWGGGPPVLTCRALASLADLLAMASHLLDSAQLLAIKGARAQLELDSAADQLAARGLVAKILHPQIAGLQLGPVVRIRRADQLD